MRSRRLATRFGVWSLTLVWLVLVATAPVRAHGFDSTDGHAVPFVVVLALSVGVGTVGGLLALRYAIWTERFREATQQRLAVALGLVLLLLGLSVLLPSAATRPVTALLGGTLGCVVGWALLVRPHRGVEATVDRATVVSGALVVHRLVEGVALAAVYVAGGTLGVAAVVLLTAHGTLESVALGVEFGTAGRWRGGVRALAAIQLSYVAAALLAMSATTSLTTLTQGLVVAAAAGVLLVVGGRELRAHTDGLAIR